ncbi:hypothetical protein BDW71DRAFT_180628 [Aspergillus fruticulosus]
MSGIADTGPKPRLHSTRSFPRMDNNADTSASTIRSRAKTVQSIAIPESADSGSLPLSLLANEGSQYTRPDLFEKSATSYAEHGSNGEASVLSRNAPNQPEELPIELISLTDRFVKSLGARVHSSPPTIDRISTLFQDFYLRAESHIATHISALASRINRDPSPHPPDRKDANASSRQMLTASEVTEKRIARKLLASKQVDLEEAVERRACESIYDKIWRHKSTLDEVRDEKLRSKTAALLLVGINLNELGVDIDITTIDEKSQKDVDDCFSSARDSLMKMNEERYPLGKLQHLAASHKAIVDALTKLLPSSSSADEILPALIYTLVTCPPEGINVISNLLFIQRFRTNSKVDGETAYCLTNLEAAVSFLENVDLSELRAEEGEGGVKAPGSDSASLAESIRPPQPASLEPTSPISSLTASAEPPNPIKSELPEPLSGVAPAQQGRLNTFLQPPAKVLGAANDAVRNTADQGLKNISATLDSSFNFLFGRLKELQSNQLPGKDGAAGPVLPKTLAEARRLVTSPASGGSALDKVETPKEPPATEPSRLRRIGSKAEDTFSGLVSGQRSPRDRSTDSVRTHRSSRALIATNVSKDEGRAPSTNSALATPTLESVRSFGSTINPLNHIPGMIRGFSRGAPESPAVSSLPNRTKAPASDSRIDPPIQRFLDIQNANELTIGDVSVLLEDYKRISTALIKQGSSIK